MSLSIKNNCGGGSLDIVNGILNEYYAQTGEIEAGTFVKIVEGIEGYITDLVNLLESNQTNSVSCVELSDNRVFITYSVAGSSSSVVYGVVVQRTTSGIVSGEVKQISTYKDTLSTYSPAQLISENVVAVASKYKDMYNASYILCKINGLSITVSSTIMPSTSSGFPIGSSSNINPLITVMNPTQFIVRYTGSASKTTGALLIVKVSDGVLQSKKVYDYNSFSPEITPNYPIGFNIFRISDTVFFMNRGPYGSTATNKFAFYSLDEDNNITLLKDIGAESFPYQVLVVWSFIKLKGYDNKYVMLYTDDNHSSTPVKISIITIGDDYSFLSYTEPVVIHTSMVGYWHEIFYNSDTKDNEFALISKHYSNGIQAIKFSIDVDGNVYIINDTIIPIQQIPLYVTNNNFCSKSYKVSEDKYRIYCKNPSYLEIDLSKEIKSIAPATSSENMIGFTKEKATTAVKGKIWLLDTGIIPTGKLKYDIVEANEDGSIDIPIFSTRLGTGIIGIREDIVDVPSQTYGAITISPRNSSDLDIYLMFANGGSSFWWGDSSGYYFKKPLSSVVDGYLHLTKQLTSYSGSFKGRWLIISAY